MVMTETIMERFDWSSTGLILESLMRSYSLAPSKSRRRLVGRGHGEHERIVLVPPAIQPILPACESDQEYLHTLPLDLASHLVVLMRSGHAALGVGTVNGLTDDKVIRRYTNRKGQGKAQSTWDAKKTAQSVGARLRRRESRAFYDDVATQLNDWSAPIQEVGRIFVACPVRLWPELFNTRLRLPFGPGDSRLQKLALAVKRPTREALYDFNRDLGKGYWAILSPQS